MRQSRPKRHGNTPERAFGVTLRELRRATNISQETLADKAGYDRTYIGLLEGGQRSPSLRTIFNLADALNVRPTQVIKKVETAYRRGFPPPDI
jgi:transcriptional regulator with XRE-family HTH domain